METGKKKRKQLTKSERARRKLEREKNEAFGPAVANDVPDGGGVYLPANGIVHKGQQSDSGKPWNQQQAGLWRGEPSTAVVSLQRNVLLPDRTASHPPQAEHSESKSSGGRRGSTSGPALSDDPPSFWPPGLPASLNLAAHPAFSGKKAAALSSNTPRHHASHHGSTQRRVVTRSSAAASLSSAPLGHSRFDGTPSEPEPPGHTPYARFTPYVPNGYLHSNQSRNSAKVAISPTPSTHSTRSKTSKIIMPIPDASASKAFSGPPPVPVPRALPAYLSQAGAEPVKLDVPQPLLLVLDLNGTLLFRPSRASPTSFRARPDLEAFVAYIMSSYSVMVWSSAKPQNVARMCDKIFSRQQRQCVVAEWGRDRLGLSAAQYNAKLQVYKQLEKVWRDAAIAAAHPCYGAGARWDQSNTVLIDDSLLKAASQPHNILPVPEYVGKPENGARPLREAVAYLEELSWYGDVSAFMRARPFAVGADWAGQAYVDGFDE